MNDLELRVSALLRRYMPALLANSILRRAEETLRIAEGALVSNQLPELATALAAGVRLFVAAETQPELLAKLERLSGAPSAPPPARIPIDSDIDVTYARRCAHQLATKLGASSFASQRAATATSELARNIVNYAGTGYIELIPSLAGKIHQLTVRATDTGPGIRNLEEILSGNYKSRSGFGRGLIGVKRLSRRFDIRSTPRGTVVEADIPI